MNTNTSEPNWEQMAKEVREIVKKRLKTRRPRVRQYNYYRNRHLGIRIDIDRRKCPVVKMSDDSLWFFVPADATDISVRGYDKIGPLHLFSVYMGAFVKVEEGDGLFSQVNAHGGFLFTVEKVDWNEEWYDVEYQLSLRWEGCEVVRS